VTFRAGKTASPEDILKHLDNGGLSKYEMPEFFLQIDEIPLTASGKVRKRDIVDWIADGRARPMPITREKSVAQIPTSS
jgi:acyl-CoA synthetase